MKNANGRGPATSPLTGSVFSPQSPRPRRAQRRGFVLRQFGLATAVLLLGAVAPAGAGTIALSEVYNHQLTATGAVSGSSALTTFATGDLFPSALGTLQDISLLFSGTVSFIVDPGLNSPAFPPVPIPFTIVPALSIEISGLTDLYDTGPFVLSTSVMSTAGGAAGNYSFGFSYLQLLEQFTGPDDVGSSFGIVLAPPPTLAGTLEDFIAGEALTNQLQLSYKLSFAEIGRVNFDPSSVTAHSSLQVITTFTYAEPPGSEPPDSEPPVTAVPEPGSAYLLFAGIAALAAARRVAGRTGRARSS